MRPIIGILCGVNQSDSSALDAIPHAYGRSVVAAGGAPLLIPCADKPDAALPILELVHGLIVTGGPDVDPAEYEQQPRKELGAISPERDALDHVCCEFILERPELPVLGICRGIQSLNVFAGGSLIQDLPSQIDNALKHSQSAPGWHGTHEVEIEADSVLAETVGCEPLSVNSFHHQAVADVAPGFRIVARTADGVVEAFEREGARYCIGCQFHPELMAARNERVAGLFQRLVDEARELAT